MHASLSFVFTIFCAAIVIGALAVLVLGKETKQQELI
jgi:putative MFS transporter